MFPLQTDTTDATILRTGERGHADMKSNTEILTILCIHVQCTCLHMYLQLYMISVKQTIRPCGFQCIHTQLPVSKRHGWLQPSNGDCRSVRSYCRRHTALLPPVLATSVFLTTDLPPPVNSRLEFKQFADATRVVSAPPVTGTETYGHGRRCTGLRRTLLAGPPVEGCRVVKMQIPDRRGRRSRRAEPSRRGHRPLR